MRAVGQGEMGMLREQPRLQFTHQIGFENMLDTVRGAVHPARGDIGTGDQVKLPQAVVAHQAMGFGTTGCGQVVVVRAGGDHETGALSATYALKDLSSTSSRNRFYTANAQLEMLTRIRMSLDKASEALGKEPDAAVLDKLVAENFPGFTLDSDLRDGIVRQQVLERNFSYPTQNTLGRMVSRQTGIYWGTSGHSTEPVIVGAIGPGAERFKGYMDNTDFGRALQQMLERP